MGASSYYDGKGSRSSNIRTSNRESEMKKLIHLLENVEVAREEVALRKEDLATAEQNLKSAEQKVKEGVNSLDIETKARFRKMMGAFGNIEEHEFN